MVGLLHLQMEVYYYDPFTLLVCCCYHCVPVCWPWWVRSKSTERTIVNSCDSLGCVVHVVAVEKCVGSLRNECKMWNYIRTMTNTRIWIHHPWLYPVWKKYLNVHVRLVGEYAIRPQKRAKVFTTLVNHNTKKRDKFIWIKNSNGIRPTIRIFGGLIFNSLSTISRSENHHSNEHPKNCFHTGFIAIIAAVHSQATSWGSNSTI